MSTTKGSKIKEKSMKNFRQIMGAAFVFGMMTSMSLVGNPKTTSTALSRRENASKPVAPAKPTTVAGKMKATAAKAGAAIKGAAAKTGAAFKAAGSKIKSGFEKFGTSVKNLFVKKPVAPAATPAASVKGAKAAAPAKGAKTAVAKGR